MFVKDFEADDYRWDFAQTEKYNEIPIIEGTNFYYRAGTRNGLHLVLDQVIYDISPVKDLSISNIPTYFPFGLKFSVQEGITPTPNRESLILTDTVKNLIKVRLKEAVAEIMEFAPKEVLPLLEWYKVREYLNFDFQGQQVQMRRKEVKGLCAEVGVPYYDNLDPVFDGIVPPETKLTNCIKAVRTQYRNKMVEGEFVITTHKGNNRLILFEPDKVLSKTLMDYYATFPTNTILVKPNYQYLWKQPDVGSNLYHLLELYKRPRDKWRAVINKWLEVQQTIMDSLETHDEEDYLEWLSNRPKPVPVKAKKALKGQVKVHYVVPKLTTRGFKLEVQIEELEAFSKNLRPIVYDLDLSKGLEQAATYYKDHFNFIVTKDPILFEYCSTSKNCYTPEEIPNTSYYKTNNNGAYLVRCFLEDSDYLVQIQKANGIYRPFIKELLETIKNSAFKQWSRSALYDEDLISQNLQDLCKAIKEKQKKYRELYRVLEKSIVTNSQEYWSFYDKYRVLVFKNSALAKENKMLRRWLTQQKVV